MFSRLQYVTLAAALGAAASLHAAPLAPAAECVDPALTRLAGLPVGPHAVGFELQKALDPTRRINRRDDGTKIGLALWYPARTGAAGRPLTTVDYRLLQFEREPSAAERTRWEADEVSAAVGWRHVGIVPLTKAQASAVLATGGIATRGAAPAAGKFPVVMVLGGQYYLSTTAEFLASHGFVVAAPFRFSDQSNEITAGGFNFTAYLEDSVRDAEWALERVRVHPAADARYVSALGHGGGGVQALLFAMRSRHVTSVANLDAGVFSSRSRLRDQAFYSPRLLRAPFLYVATAETRKGQDLFEDFAAMKFAERFEVILQDALVRHHDLSDLGRGVTMPMCIRGDAQDTVQKTYTDSHEMLLRFVTEHSGRHDASGSPFATWIRGKEADGRVTVTRHAGTEPAPTPADVMARLDASTASRLVDAWARDPDAALFQVDNLRRVVAKALGGPDAAVASALADFAVTVHPSSPMLLVLKSEALEAAGDIPRAAAAAGSCAAMQAGSDWRASAAILECHERADRLSHTSRPGGRGADSAAETRAPRPVKASGGLRQR
jgi:hypothetical protein